MTITPRPDCADYWPELAKVANHMLARRIADLPGRVAAGKIAQVEADHSIAFMRATATIWNAVINHIDIPPIAPSWGAITADLATAAARAQRLAQPDYAAYVAALHWHSLPLFKAGATPHIVFIHRCNQTLRAWREAAAPTQERIAA